MGGSEERSVRDLEKSLRELMPQEVCEFSRPSDASALKVKGHF